MDFFISAAMAQDGAPAAPSMIAQLLPLVILVVLFYFMLIRPQQKRNREHKELLASLSTGSEIVINGGIAGKITSVGEVYLTMEVAEGTQIKVQKAAVAQVLPAGTLEAL